LRTSNTTSSHNDPPPTAPNSDGSSTVGPTPANDLPRADGLSRNASNPDGPQVDDPRRADGPSSTHGHPPTAPTPNGQFPTSQHSNNRWHA
jgi:hypothetical protein